MIAGTNGISRSGPRQPAVARRAAPDARRSRQRRHLAQHDSRPIHDREARRGRPSRSRFRRGRQRAARHADLGIPSAPARPRECRPRRARRPATPDAVRPSSRANSLPRRPRAAACSHHVAKSSSVSGDSANGRTLIQPATPYGPAIAPITTMASARSSPSSGVRRCSARPRAAGRRSGSGRRLARWRRRLSRDAGFADASRGRRRCPTAARRAPART